MKKVRINIDSLSLDGISRGDTEGFVRGLEQELTKLVRENGISTSSSDPSGIGVLNVGTIHPARGEYDSAGKSVAHSLYRRLKNE